MIGYPLGISLVFGAYEMARETGTLRLFLVRFCKGRQDELDRSAELHRSE